MTEADVQAARRALEHALLHPQEWHLQREGLFRWYVEALGPTEPGVGRYGWIAGPFWFRRPAQRHIDREKARHG